MEEIGQYIAHGLAMIGIGAAVLGGSIGIGLIGGRGIEAFARQPEEYKRIRTLMILMAALIEGIAFLGIIIGLIVVTK